MCNAHMILLPHSNHHRSPARASQPLITAHEHIAEFGKFVSGVDCRATGGAKGIEGHRGAKSEGRGVMMRGTGGAEVEI
jgi:hypothetical protein